jgi:hypothetical protein
MRLLCEALESMSKKKLLSCVLGDKSVFRPQYLPQKQSVPEWSEETTSIHPEDFWDSPQFFLSFFSDSKPGRLHQRRGTRMIIFHVFYDR